MPTSYNGWPASPSLDLRSFVIDDVGFPPGVADRDDVATVLGYVIDQFEKRVEWLREGWCWGFSYRATTAASSLSCHASGTAVDANAPLHPFGVPTSNTFTAAEIAEVHQILAEVDHVIRWGGDYTTPGRQDAMHFEVNVTPESGRLAAAAEKIRSNNMDESDVKKIVVDAIAAALNPLKNAERVRWQNERKRDKAQATRDRANGKLLRTIAKQLDAPEVDEIGRALEADANERERDLAAHDTPPEH